MIHTKADEGTGSIHRQRARLAEDAPDWVNASYREADSLLSADYCQKQEEIEAFESGKFAALIARLVELVYPKQAAKWNAGSAKHRYLNIVKMMTRTLAVAVQQRPEVYLTDEDGNRLDEDHPESVRWAKDAKQIGFIKWMRSMDRKTVLHRTRFGQAAWVKGKPRWWNHAPYRVKIDYDPDDAGRIDQALGIHVNIKQGATEEKTNKGRRISWVYNKATGDYGVYHVDSAGHRFHVGLFDKEDGANGYGRHPFAVFQSDEPEDGEIYLNPREDWWAEIRYICRWLMALANTGDYQGFSIPVLTKWEGDQKPTVTPGTPIALEGDGTFRFETPSAPLTQLEAMFENALRRFAVAEGLPANIWSINTSTVSMAAARILRQPLEERRVERIEPTETALDVMFENHKAVCNYHRNGDDDTRYSDGTRLVVGWRPVPMPVDPFQEAQALETRFRLNIDNPVSTIMREQRVDRERAEVIHKRNIEINETNQRSAPNPAHPPGAPRSPDVRSDG